MSDIKIVIGSEVSGAVSGLQKVQGELGKTAAVSKTATAAFTGIGSSISSLGASLISGGVLTGVALLGAGLIALAKDTFSLSEEQKRLSDVLGEAKNAYVKSTIEVDKMKVAFEQARSGVITKEEALKLYNSTIGKTIGQTKDLDEAERIFTAQADNYIKFTLLKAAANIALGKAAEAAFRQEQIRMAGSDNTNKEGILATIMYGQAVGKTIGEVKDFNDAIKEENDFLKIANSLQEQAKAFGFDYNGIVEKEVKLRKERAKAIKAEIEASRVAAIGNIQQVKPKERDIRTVFEQDVVIKPKVSIEITPEQRDRIAEGLKQLFNLARIEQLAEEFGQQVERVISDTVLGAAVGISDAVAAALSGTQDAIPNLFGSLMSNVGSQIQDLGKFLIKSAITIKVAKEAFQKLLANPVAAALVGIGLVALGALLKAQASKQFKGFASGTSALGEGGVFDVGERGRERIFLPRGSSVQPANEVNAFSGGGITLMPSIAYDGTRFRIFLNRVDAQMGRNN